MPAKQQVRDLPQTAFLNCSGRYEPSTGAEDSERSGRLTADTAKEAHRLISEVALRLILSDRPRHRHETSDLSYFTVQKWPQRSAWDAR